MINHSCMFPHFDTLHSIGPCLHWRSIWTLATGLWSCIFGNGCSGLSLATNWRDLQRESWVLRACWCWRVHVARSKAFFKKIWHLNTGLNLYFSGPSLYLWTYGWRICCQLLGGTNKMTIRLWNAKLKQSIPCCFSRNTAMSPLILVKRLYSHLAFYATNPCSTQVRKAQRSFLKIQL